MGITRNQLKKELSKLSKKRKKKPKKGKKKRSQKTLFKRAKSKYSKYLKSEEWLQIKLDLYYERGKKCEHCGSTKNIHVHHLTYKNIYKEEPEDLILLCKNCHKKEHGIK